MLLKFHYDAGHGWLAVPKSISLAANYKSEYSYQDATHYYLEEDCDASNFIEAWHNANPLERIKVIEVNDGDSSPIRDLL